MAGEPTIVLRYEADLRSWALPLQSMLRGAGLKAIALPSSAPLPADTGVHCNLLRTAKGAAVMTFAARGVEYPLESSNGDLSLVRAAGYAVLAAAGGGSQPVRSAIDTVRTMFRTTASVSEVLQIAAVMAQTASLPLVTPETVGAACVQYGRSNPLGQTTVQQLAAIVDADAYQRFAEEHYPPYTAGPSPAEVSVAVSELLIHAHGIARMMSNSGVIALRHLIAALYLIDDHGTTYGTLEHWGGSRGALADRYTKFVIPNCPGDNGALWLQQIALDTSVRNASAADRPAEQDALGFTPYVKAVTTFLLNKETQGPLAMSVEGEWGSGKSSFMKQVKKEIGARDRQAICVDFNAWRHDKDEALWAAFATEFLTSVREYAGWRARLNAHVKLLRLRFEWRENGVDLARMAGVLVIAIVAFAWSFGAAPNYVAAFKIGGGAALAAAWYQATKLLGDPLKIDVKRYLRAPDYQSRIAFIESFHRDFEKMLLAYVGKERKVFVFIDDLDRCAVPKAADIMQAMNLLISDRANVIFILGLDRDKIAASLAVKFKEVLPFLTADSKDTPAKEVDPRRALEYGTSFLEKFIQVSFALPQPTPDDVRTFVRNVLGVRGEAKADAPAPQPEKPAAEAEDEDEQRQIHDAVEQLQLIERVVSRDSERIQKIIEELAPALEFNPRRVKQFINALRLRTFIATTTGKLDHTSGKRSVTIEKIAKYVALTLRYPRLVADLEAEPLLLNELQTVAHGGQAQALARVSFWSEHQPAMDILRIGKGNDAYDLSEVSVPALLRL
jgi:hypothetical protein